MQTVQGEEGRYYAVQYEQRCAYVIGGVKDKSP